VGPRLEPPHGSKSSLDAGPAIQPANIWFFRRYTMKLLLFLTRNVGSGSIAPL
jgi:hypothetical protein